MASARYGLMWIINSSSEAVLIKEKLETELMQITDVFLLRGRIYSV